MADMTSASAVTIRAGGAGDVHALAGAFRQMWLDNGIPGEQIEPDYVERVARFVHESVEGRWLRFFIAERDGGFVGAACCQLFDGLYPAILIPEVRRYGYIWGVHVAAGERRAGLGRRLTEACVEALRSLGCTHALLHAAPSGRGIYERLGFAGTNEMRLSLAES
jgi:ribosomal protein S18 acetylase RimI-like enzyme